IVLWHIQGDAPGLHSGVNEDLEIRAIKIRPPDRVSSRVRPVHLIRPRDVSSRRKQRQDKKREHDRLQGIRTTVTTIHDNAPHSRSPRELRGGFKPKDLSA